MGKTRISILVLVIAVVSIQVLIISKSLKRTHAFADKRAAKSKPDSQLDAAVIVVGHTDNYSEAMAQYNITLAPWPTTLVDSGSRDEPNEMVTFWKSAGRRVMSRVRAF